MGHWIVSPPSTGEWQAFSTPNFSSQPRATTAAAHANERSGWLSLAKEQLALIAGLGPGWDSDGASAPDALLVHRALTLLECLFTTSPIPKPHINPTRRGGVQFEWENAGRYFELEVDSPHGAAYFFHDESLGVEAEGRISVGESLEKPLEFIRRACLGPQALGRFER